MLAAALLAVALAACAPADSDSPSEAGSRAELTAAERGRSAPDQSSRDDGHGGDVESNGDAVVPNGDATLEEKESVSMRSTLVDIRVGEASLRMTLADTAAARELAERLRDGSVTLELHDYGGFEKVGPLPWGLPAADERVVTEPGDVVLYQGNQISMFYGGNSWSYTMLGHVDGATREGMLDVLGGGDPTVELSLS